METTIKCTLSACLCTLPVILILGVIIWRNADYLLLLIGYPFAPFIKRRPPSG